MKRPVVMILLAGALTLSMIAPSALPAVAGNVSVVHGAAKISNTAPAETSNDAVVKTSNDVTAETSSDEDAGKNGIRITGRTCRNRIRMENIF